MKKKSPAEMQRAKVAKTARTLIRLRHSLAADEEINARLPETLEEFDAGGLMRADEVDSRSTLPDKTEVADFAALRKYLAEDRIDQVAFGVLKHLMVYATGRDLSYGELAFLRQDALRLKADGYRMRDLIRYVVTSKPFLEK